MKLDPLVAPLPLSNSTTFASLSEEVTLKKSSPTWSG